MHEVTIAQLTELLIPAVEALDYDWWGCVLQRHAHRALLRIYIDKPGGVNVEDCAAVSHQVNGVLAVTNLLPEDYTLEVSSPGLDRPLFKLPQYRQFIGETIKLRSRLPWQGQRNFQGILQTVEENYIVLRCGTEVVQLSFDNIERANVVPNFS